MALSKRGIGMAGMLAAAILGFLTYAWIDGGREPLRDIAVPVAVSGAAR